MSLSKVSFQKLAHTVTLLVLVGLTGFGCGQNARSSSAFKMGERIEVGGLVYTVLEADWRNQLGEGAEAQLPKHRFLLIKVAVTNGAGQQRDIPLLHIEDARKNSYMELSEVKDLSGWLGMIRLLPPGGIEDGWMVFDAPPGNYQLRLVSREGEDEVSRYVEIPLTLKDDSSIKM